MKTATLTEQQNYHSSIVVNANVNEVFNKISRVNEWWALNFKGSANKAGDVFTINWGETYVTFKLTEALPAENVTWLVTDCYLPWLNNKTEWTETEVVFKISEQNGATKLEMTHVGLTPEAECYDDCQAGWDHYIKKSLFNFIEKGQGVLQKG